jgi:hypothetical protein
MLSAQREEVVRREVDDRAELVLRDCFTTRLPITSAADASTGRRM